MRINNNISALNAWRGLTNTDNALSKSLEKLSSGLRINRAGDDAAGLAISEKMRGQIRGLNQAVRNAQDGISLIQTAEGALTETHAILQRMRELAVQSANDTNTDSDRTEIHKEMEQLLIEINRISTDTEFNTKNLLNGNAGFSAKVDVSTGMTVLDGGRATEGTLTFDSIKSATQAVFKVGAFVAGDGAAEDLKVAVGTFKINGVEIATTDTTTDNLVSVINAQAAKTGLTAKMDSNVLVLTSSAVGSAARIDVQGLDGIVSATTAGTGVVTMTTDGTDVANDGDALINAIASGADADVTSSTLGSGGNISAAGNTVTIVGGTFDGMKLRLADNVDVSSNAGSIEVTSNNSLTLQIGANENQVMSIAVNDMSSDALQISGINVLTSGSAQLAISRIQQAIETVSAERSKLGAYQNRLEHTIKNLGVSSENLAAAESRIRDVDMAAEMMNFTKQNILMQAGTAMLAQANARPQSVLQLLG